MRQNGANDAGFDGGRAAHDARVAARQLAVGCRRRGRAGVPAFLPPIEAKDRRPTRLDLAAGWLAPDNPLVARVFVNRLWKLAFGQGIVKTLDDFGSQGARADASRAARLAGRASSSTAAGT